MNDRIDLTDMRKELVSQSLAMACPFYESGNVDEFNGCRRHFLWMIHFCENIQTMVRNHHHSCIGFNGTERKIGRLCIACLCDCIKQRALSDVREPDYAKLHVIYSSPIPQGLPMDYTAFISKIKCIFHSFHAPEPDGHILLSGQWHIEASVEDSHGLNRHIPCIDHIDLILRVIAHVKFAERRSHKTVIAQNPFTVFPGLSPDFIPFTS